MSYHKLIVSAKCSEITHLSVVDISLQCLRPCFMFRRLLGQRLNLILMSLL